MDKQTYGQGFIFHTDLKDLQVRPIIAREEEFWDTMMSRYHYLGFRTLVGESLKYIAILDDQVVGLIGWGTAAFKNHHRDKWIGWNPEIQWQRLKFIANNMRFLILARIKNLASKILSENVKLEMKIQTTVDSKIAFFIFSSPYNLAFSPQSPVFCLQGLGEEIIISFREPQRNAPLQVVLIVAKKPLNVKIFITASPIPIA